MNALWFRCVVFFVLSLTTGSAQTADSSQSAVTPTPAVNAPTPIRGVGHDPLAPPIFQPGNWCRYSQSDFLRALPDYQEEIASVSPGGEVVTRTTMGDRSIGYLRLTRDGNEVAFYRGGMLYTNTPVKEYFQFPLTPDKTWRVEVRQPYSEQKTVIGTRFESLAARFLGVKTVTVPAGTFQAIGVRLTGQYHITVDEGNALGKRPGNVHDSLSEEVWFATAIGCVVKREVDERRFWRVYRHYQRQLISFQHLGDAVLAERR